MIRKLKFIFSRKFFPALLSISAGLALSAITRSRRLMVFALDQRKRAEQVEVELLTHYSEKFSRKLKIAVVRFDGLGDNALTLPLLDALQADERVAEVFAIVPEKVAFALSGFYSGKLFPVRPFSIHYPRLGKTMASSLVTYSFVGAFLSWHQGLRVKKLLGQIDLVVLPRWDHDLDLNTRFFARGLGKFVVGHNPKWIENSHRELSDIALLDYVCDSPDRSAHDFTHLVDLADTLGLRVSKQRPETDLEPLDVKTQVFLQVSAALQKRVWDISKWNTLLMELARLYPNWHFVANTSDDIEFRQLIAGIPGAESGIFSRLDTNTQGALSLALKTSAFYLGSDTGPMHLADYLGIRSIVISCHPITGRSDHVNSPQRFGNSNHLGFWIAPKIGLQGCLEGCESTRAHCINSITPEELIEAVRNLVVQ